MKRNQYGSKLTLCLATALMGWSLGAWADGEETVRFNLGAALECTDGHTVSYQGRAYQAPEINLELYPQPHNGATVNVTQEWRGTFEDTFSQKAVEFGVKLTLSKILFTDGSVVYFLNVFQGHQALVALTTKTVEELKAVKVNGLVGEYLPRDKGKCRPLFKLE